MEELDYDKILAFYEDVYSGLGSLEYLVYSPKEMADAYQAAWGTNWDSEEWKTLYAMEDINMESFYEYYTSTTSSTDATTSTDTTTITVATSGYSTECVGYINELRTSVGVATLTWSDSLAEVALARANELAEAGALDGHEGLSKYGSYGENIFWSSVSSASAYDAYTGWYNSEGHYNNMVRSSYTNVAVAYATSGSGSFWVTIFK
ncbi:MAG: CAP domain-containing protein [Lachnospiraceae bacterium]|nr:CAP domain-containing protein [Lachnospiraceae bacterium]